MTAFARYALAVNRLADAEKFVAAHPGQRIGLCNGAFDLLHVGHLRYLTAAKREVDLLVVAINADASVRRAKGEGRPAIPEAERLELVSALKPVDFAFVFDTETVDPILEALRPAAHFKGTDYTPGTVPERATAQRLGITVRIVGDAKDHSTTALLK
jgi:rfaE bifunctional protein nucleotidyltransferase chain/domain